MEITLSKDDIAIFTNLFLKIETEVYKIAQKIFVHDKIKKTGEEIDIKGFRFANHNKEIVIVNYMPTYSSYYKDLQFPASFLYNENWEKEYVEEVKRKEAKSVEDFNKMLREEDMKRIAALKIKYPEEFTK